MLGFCSFSPPPGPVLKFTLQGGGQELDPPTFSPALRTAGLPTPVSLHLLEVAGLGEEDQWEGHVRFQDGHLNHSHNQHVRLEDVGTGGNKVLRKEQGQGKKVRGCWPRGAGLAWRGQGWSR